MALDQSTRLFSFNVAGLADDELELVSLNGEEEISRLFSFGVELISDNNQISAAQVVGKNVTIEMTLADDSPRYFNGFINRFSAGDEDEEGRRNYSADIVPWFWFLTQTADCRIFQNKTIPQIVEQIFQDLGFNDFETNEIKGNHKEWEYCVQYRETDFNFVSRLLEQEGIFYYFRHEAGKHTMVLADQKNAYKDCVEKEVDYPYDFGSRPLEDYITSWEHNYEFHSGKWAHTDYDFKKPSTNLMAQTNTKTNLVNIKKYEIYDYPGEYVKKSDGEGEVRLRIEEEETQHDVVEASSLCKSFTAGGKFKLREHRAKTEEGKKFVITSVQHSANETMPYETGGGGGGQEYSNSFSAIPDSVVFRPARVTPKPLVSGLQTAVVVGPAGEEIYCDKYGRIKVQFHWDREGKKDENSSCWIRCMQSSAGKKWGTVFIPRIGQEVVVDFLEGDPDRPLVTGLVYNDEQMPHYELPSEKTKSYIKTNSSKSGEGFNEICFEDKKDEERVFIHAEKNMDTRVKNDSKTRIFGNRHQIIGWEKDGEKGGDQRELVYEDKHLNVKANQVEKIEGNYQLCVGNGDAPDGGNLDVVIEKQRTESIGSGNDRTVGGDEQIKIGGNLSETIDMDHQTKVGMNQAVEAGMEVHIKAGMKVIIEAGLQLSLVGPGGFIDIGPAGVTIQGIMVKINSGGAAGTGSGCSPGSPQEAEEAAPAEPAIAHDSKSGQKSAPN
jgi:type VI secretion system secreted protein VgrG